MISMMVCEFKKGAFSFFSFHLLDTVFLFPEVSIGSIIPKERRTIKHASAAAIQYDIE